MKHRILTGADNALILENLRMLDEKITSINPTPKLIIRLPIIKNHNDGDDFAEEAAGFLTASLRNYSFVELMPFHNLGESKYRFLDVNYELAGCPNLRKEDVADFAGKLSSRGIPVHVADW